MLREIGLLIGICGLLAVANGCLLLNEPFRLSDRPSWIQSVSHEVEQGRLVSILVDQAALWETGDDFVNLARQLVDSIEVEIDGELLPTGQFETFSYELGVTRVYDPLGNELASHTGRFYVSFSAPLEIGTHSATIQMTSTSGQLYSYSWDFEIISRPPATKTPEVS